MKPFLCLTLTLAAFWASPAFATEQCAGCPRVQLLRAEDQIRIAAQDDHDPYEALRHRVRFVSSAGASAWSDWADTNAYGLTTEISGRVEAETIDLEGNVGRGIISVTSPSAEEGSVGPRSVEEDSSAEARWDDESTTPGDATIEDPPPAPASENSPTTYLQAEEWDHSVCPVAQVNVDDDSACSTAPGVPNNGMLAALLAFAGMLLSRGVRRRD